MHSSAGFKQTKQNRLLHEWHSMILYPSLVCSISMPQDVQTRTAGHWTFLTDVKVIIGQSFSRSWLMVHPTLPHRSPRGWAPFHSLKHCQQNKNVFPVFSVQMEHFTRRLETFILSMKVPQPGHWIWKEKTQRCTRSENYACHTWAIPKMAISIICNIVQQVLVTLNNLPKY